MVGWALAYDGLQSKGRFPISSRSCDLVLVAQKGRGWLDELALAVGEAKVTVKQEGL